MSATRSHDPSLVTSFGRSTADPTGPGPQPQPNVNSTLPLRLGAAACSRVA